MRRAFHVTAISACLVGALGCGSGTTSETFSRANWATLAADPNKHQGASVDIVGRVIAAPQRDEQGTYWGMWVDPDKSKMLAVVAYADPSFRIKGGDFAHVIGRVKGNLKGANSSGTRLTRLIAPLVLADKATIVSVAPVPTSRPKDPVALVTAKAGAASRVPVDTVACAKEVQARDTHVTTCAVTFAGPACQLWIVSRRGSVATALPPPSPPMQRSRGLVDARSGRARCESTHAQ